VCARPAKQSPNPSLKLALFHRQKRDEGTPMMITLASKTLVRKSFKKIRYRFMDAPQPRFRGVFGVYTHVPFCYTICSFCPFYKERFTEERKQQCVNAILKEIETTDMEGAARWLYFGGGTPNTLSLDKLARILAVLSSKVQVDSIGIVCGEEPISHSGEEFVYCVEGEIEYLVDEEWHRLEAGDSLIFQSQQLHMCRNNSIETAIVLLVILPAEGLVQLSPHKHLFIGSSEQSTSP
jgi:hypothetical protein